MNVKYPAIHFTAAIRIRPFGAVSPDKETSFWWNDREATFPLVNHIRDLCSRLIALSTRPDIALSNGVGSSQDNATILNLLDPEETDLLGVVTVYVRWTRCVSEADEVLTTIKSWDASTHDVISKADGIGAVSCDVFGDVDLDLDWSSTTDEFDEATNVCFRLTCQ